MASNCAYLSIDHETEFSTELLSMFSPHATLPVMEQKKVNSLSGWDVCPNLHDEDSPVQCANDYPYLALQLVQMTLSDVEEAYTSPTRSTFADNNKRRSRIPPTLNLTIKRSKSSRCLPTSYIRGIHQSGIRYDTKFPTLFHGIREINYEFPSTVDHKKHADVYRNSYTETLIRNFRELHQANVSIGERCQRGTRLSMSDGSASSKPMSQQGTRNCTNETSKKKGCHSAPSQSPVFYSDQCQTGPIVILSGTNITSKNPEFFSSASVCYLPKSTMEINNVVSYRSPQHRSFGEQSLKSKIIIGESPTSHKPVRERSGDLLFLKKKGHDQSNRADVPSRNGPFARNAVTPPSHRRVSPFGRVPVRVRRSSPSIRGKRDPSVGMQGVNRFLSIAVATHTVASPFRSEASHSEENLTRLHKNI